jgi:hypothetical protein
LGRYLRNRRPASLTKRMAIEDVLEYSPASGRPPVEFGKLIDDLSVRAMLLTDAGDPLVLPKDETHETLKAATCLAEAQKVAAHEKGVVGRQTNSVVVISHPAASEFSFGLRWWT